MISWIESDADVHLLSPVKLAIANATNQEKHALCSAVVVMMTAAVIPTRELEIRMMRVKMMMKMIINRCLEW